MFRGFEIILRGKDPQAGLVVTRASAASAAAATSTSPPTPGHRVAHHVPPNATLIRNICQACETLQSIPRYFYALFAIDLTNKNYAKSKMYDEAVRRFAPYVGPLPEGRCALNKPVEVYAIFGGQWPHSSSWCPAV
jgi:hydrogenase large subunit